MVGLIPLLFAFSFDTLKYSEMSCVDAQNIIDRVYEYNQQSEFITREDAVFGQADRSVTKSTFKVNDSIVTDQRLITLRYDVNTKLCDQFRFGIRSTDGTEWHLLSFNILSDAQALPVLNQSTRVQ